MQVTEIVAGLRNVLSVGECDELSVTIVICCKLADQPCVSRDQKSQQFWYPVIPNPLIVTAVIIMKQLYAKERPVQLTSTDVPVVVVDPPRLASQRLDLSAWA